MYTSDYAVDLEHEIAALEREAAALEHEVSRLESALHKTHEDYASMLDKEIDLRATADAEVKQLKSKIEVVLALCERRTAKGDRWLGIPEVLALLDGGELDE